MITDLAEAAWVVEKWLGGKTQREIGDLMGVTTSVVCTIIGRFCRFYLRRPLDGYYGEHRKTLAAWCFKQFTGKEKIPIQPVFHRVLPKPMNSHVLTYADLRDARIEHAMLLRCEGLTLQEIGLRLGVGAETARQLIKRGGWHWERAMRKTRWQFSVPAEEPEWCCQ